jgi:hypothetical protein
MYSPITHLYLCCKHIAAGEDKQHHEKQEDMMGLRITHLCCKHIAAGEDKQHHEKQEDMMGLRITH